MCTYFLDFNSIPESFNLIPESHARAIIHHHNKWLTPKMLRCKSEKIHLLAGTHTNVGDTFKFHTAWFVYNCKTPVPYPFVYFV